MNLWWEQYHYYLYLLFSTVSETQFICEYALQIQLSHDCIVRAISLLSLTVILQKVRYELLTPYRVLCSRNISVKSYKLFYRLLFDINILHVVAYDNKILYIIVILPKLAIFIFDKYCYRQFVFSFFTKEIN